MRAREKRKAIEKRQVLMLYRLGKTSTKKNLRGIGGGNPPTPHLYVRKLKQNAFVSFRPDEEMCLIYSH